jgi:hypothetical protein
MVEPLEPGEMIVESGAAVWRENPYAESREDAQGALYLTNKRVVFETDQVQPFVSLPFDAFVGAEITDRRRGSVVQLLLVHIGGEGKTFWVDEDLARHVLQAVRPLHG